MVGFEIEKPHGYVRVQAWSDEISQHLDETDLTCTMTEKKESSHIKQRKKLRRQFRKTSIDVSSKRRIVKLAQRITARKHGLNINKSKICDGLHVRYEKTPKS